MNSNAGALKPEGALEEKLAPQVAMDSTSPPASRQTDCRQRAVIPGTIRSAQFGAS
jgi:hypothetical protein